jgi:Protein of unknown function (DUF3352)
MVAAGAAALAVGLGFVACGGGGDDDEATVPAAASVTPADAPLFGSAVVRPEGDQREAADDALSKLLNTDDPGAFIVEQLDGLLEEEDTGITYSADIEPALGENAGFFLTSFTEDADGALAVEVTDEAAAQATIDKVEAASESRLAERSYQGVDYQAGEDGNGAVGFVEDFLVAGTEEGLRDAVDASQGSSLADDDAFRDELDAAPDDSLATVYADVPIVLDRLVDAGEISAEERASVEEQVGDVVRQPALAALTAADDNIALQVAAGAGDTPAPEESPLLRELPADAWLAFGATDIGDDLQRSFDQFLATVPGYDEFNAELEGLLGARAEELVGWIGDAGGYASGTSIFGLGAALELETTDEATSGDVISGIQQALGRDPSLRVEPLGGDAQGFTVSPADAPVQIVVEQREGRVVVGLGENSVEAVLEPTDTIGESDPFGTAVDALGSEYAANVFLDFEPVLELFESTGEGDDPEYQAAKPYLDHLDYLIAGQRREGDRNVMRAVLGLR